MFLASNDDSLQSGYDFINDGIKSIFTDTIRIAYH